MIDNMDLAGPVEQSAIEAQGIGRKYRRGWALHDASFRLPAGRICGLVGPNGAGKTTLMNLAANLIEPTAGALRIFGARPDSREARRRISFLTQEKPLFRRFTVAETLRLGRELNPRWDQRSAEAIVRAGNIPMHAKVGSLSGGQRTRVAFALAFGKRPDLLMLDEPLADLDPLVRHEMAALLTAEVAEHGTTVLLSSHLLSELESLCDYLVVIAGGGVRMAGDVDELLSAHALVYGLGEAGTQVPHDLVHHTLIETRNDGRQFTALVRPDGPIGAPWQVSTPNMEELLLAYLRNPGAPALISPTARVSVAA